MRATKQGQKESWYEQVADVMVREALSFEQAATKLGLALSTEECEKFKKRKEFQRAVWAARNRFYAEIGSDPTRSKYVVLGLMSECVQQLMREGEFKDAADAILKLARVEGYVGGEQEVNVFHGLTAKELDEVKREVQKTLTAVEPVDLNKVKELLN